MKEREFNLDEFPDSPYAAELRNSDAWLRFALPLESEYRAFQLQRAIRHVRLWQLFLLVLGLGLAVKNSLDSSGSFAFEQAIRWAVLVPGCLLLTVTAWSPRYLTQYPIGAAIGMPVVSIVSAGIIGHSIAGGNMGALAYLTASIFAAFLLVGALFQQAVALALMIIASFIAGGLLSGIALGSLVYVAGLLGATACMCALVSYSMEQSNRQSFLERGLLAELAIRDGLTGLRNRRTLDEHLAKLWQQGLRDRQAVALLLIDIDHFKSYNDLLGHQAGDETLRAVSRAVKSCARRPLDIAARYGGEELAIVLYQATPERVREVAEQVRHSVEDRRIDHPGSPTSPCVTVSIGAASVRPTRDGSVEALVRAADEALYAAKREGRNRVNVVNPMPANVVSLGSRRANS